MFRWLVLLILLPAAAHADPAALDRWIARQAEIRTLSAEFTQTRSLRVLRHPVAATGRLWFAAPGDFRWQVGDPPRTIVLRDGDDVRVIEPAKKVVKREAVDLGCREAGMLDFPFVKSRADLERRFAIVDFRVDGDRGILRLKPRGGEEFLTGLELIFLTGQGHLESLEMTFRDGSSMRSEFHNVEVNRPLPADIFAVDVTGYQVRDASR